MRKLFDLRALAVVAGVTAFSLIGTGSAVAATATASQNSDLTVSVTTDKESASYGDSVTVTRTVTNNTSKKQNVTVDYELTTPTGQVHTYSERLTVAPGQPLSWSNTYMIDSSYAPGTYTLEWTAGNGKSASSCSISFEVTPAPAV